MIKTIFITGSEGMVGKNIIERVPSYYKLLIPKKKDLNLLNYDDVFNFIKKEKPDLIIHCAGIVGGINANIANPVRFLVDNIEMGINLIMASQRNNINNFINLGSSCMYPKNATNPLKEDMILKGELEPTNEGYAIAKIVSQRLTEYINRENSKLNYKTVIPCNLYGKWDKFDSKNSHMIPAVIKKLHDAKVAGLSEVEIWGDGLARREFMFATDFADFIWYAIANFNEMPLLMNVGLGYDYTINDYYKIIAKVTGYKGKFINNLSKPVGMKQKLVDITLLKNFGWQSSYSLEIGISETYRFFLNYYYE
jgi:GDP-L-fucose synthase